MSNKFVLWITIEIIVILALIGMAYLWQKQKSVLLPQKIATVQAEDKISSSTDFSVNSSQTDKEKARKQQGDCPKIPFVSIHAGLSVNNKPSVKEYVVPINCSESFVFKRKGTGEKNNEWGGIFNVYYQDDDLKKYLFEHQGLLINIAGYTFWDVSREGDVIHMSLGFGDMGIATSWDYYISHNTKELLVGLTDGLNILVGDSKKYELKLDTDPVWCQEESAIRTTKSIMYNSQEYTLENEILEPCKGNTDDIFPPPRITVRNVNISKNQVTLNVPENENIIFDYRKGEFIK